MTWDSAITKVNETSLYKTFRGHKFLIAMLMTWDLNVLGSVVVGKYEI